MTKLRTQENSRALMSSHRRGLKGIACQCEFGPNFNFFMKPNPSLSLQTLDFYNSNTRRKPPASISDLKTEKDQEILSYKTVLDKLTLFSRTHLHCLSRD